MKDTLLKWRIEEYEILSETQNQVKVRVKPLYPVTSKNGRKYTFDEMLESARTMNGKLINVNHNDTRKIGNVEWAKANKQTQFMEVEGTINKEPYTYMVKNHDSKIKGWSVQADFRHAQCIHCSEKFDTMEALKTHLVEKEHIHNIEFEPKDIVFNGLALVIDPEVPGIPNTSYMSETVGTRNFGSLEEMINTLEAEEDSWLLNKFGNNRDEKSMSKNYAIENKGSPVAPTSKTYTKEELQKTIMPETKKEASDKVDVKSPSLNTVETPVLNVAVEKVMLKEAASIGKLIFEEESCTPFEQCVKDGGTPEECAAKFKETVQRNKTNRTVAETVNALIDAVSKPIVLEIAKDDTSWNTKISMLQHNIENRLTTAASEFVDVTNKWNSKVAELMASIDAIKPYNDAPLKEAIANIKPFDDKPLREMDLRQEEIIANLNKNLLEVNTKVNAIKIPDVPAPYDDSKLKEIIASQKRDFETVLAVADKNIAETKKTLEERIEALKKEKDGLKETLEKQDLKLKEALVRTDNLEDKQQPVFKGVAKSTVKAKDIKDPVVGNPLEQHRRVS